MLKYIYRHTKRDNIIIENIQNKLVKIAMVECGLTSICSLNYYVSIILYFDFITTFTLIIFDIYSLNILFSSIYLSEFFTLTLLNHLRKNIFLKLIIFLFYSTIIDIRSVYIKYFIYENI